MRKKITIILLVLIGIAILSGCKVDKTNDQIDDSVFTNQPVAKTQTDNLEDKAKVDSPAYSKGADNNEIDNDKSSQQKNKFTKEDLSVFKLIKRYYEDFYYSDTYTNTSEDNKKMVFSKENNLYFDQYVSYDVIYNSEVKMITYFFDHGTINRGFGSYYVIDDDTVIKIEKSVGTSGYGYEIYKNGKSIDKEFKPYN